jgi:hypothetical protein
MYFNSALPLFLAPLVVRSAVALPSSSKLAGGKAIYMLSNDESNAVLALPICENGLLSAGTLTATGGKGGNGVDGSTKQPAAPDALFSQGSLTVAGNV